MHIHTHTDIDIYFGYRLGLLALRFLKKNLIKSWIQNSVYFYCRVVWKVYKKWSQISMIIQIHNWRAGYSVFNRPSLLLLLYNLFQRLPVPNCCRRLRRHCCCLAKLSYRTPTKNHLHTSFFARNQRSFRWVFNAIQKIHLHALHRLKCSCSYRYFCHMVTLFQTILNAVKKLKTNSLKKNVCMYVPRPLSFAMWMMPWRCVSPAGTMPRQVAINKLFYPDA